VVKIAQSRSGIQNQENFERTIKGHQEAVQSLSFAAGTILASSSTDLSIKLWDWDTYECIKTMQGHDHIVSCVNFLPTNDFIISSSRDKSIKLWEVATGYCTKTLQGHDAWVRQVIVSPDGSLLASCSMEKTIKLWNLKTGECIRTLREHYHVIETICFSTPAVDQQILKYLEGAKEGKEDDGGKGKANHVEKKQTSKDDKKGAENPSGVGGLFLVSGSRDRLIKIWQIETGTCVKTLDAHDNWVRSIAWHPSGRYLISAADDKTIRCFDITKNWRQVKKFDEAHSLFITSIAYNKTLPMLASSSVDATIKLWECR
jgi:platelet-activating factor acetylhydrolase IB subunit alpha